MYYGSDVIFIYDGTFEGFLSAVFDAYSLKITPVNITTDKDIQESFDTEYHYVNTSDEKSDRVIAGMNKIGGGFTGNVTVAFFSWMPDREMVIYRYIVLGFEIKHKIFNKLDDDIVIRMSAMVSQVGREINKLTGFLRFSVLENNLMYAEMSPKNNCLPFLLPHFSERMKVIPFLIHDLTYNQVGIYDTKESYIRSSEGLTLPKYSADELQYRRMWKCFYDTIAIEGRVNPKLRQQLMPKRYHKHIFEMQDHMFSGELDMADSPDTIVQKQERGRDLLTDGNM